MNFWQWFIKSKKYLKERYRMNSQDKIVKLIEDIYDKNSEQGEIAESLRQIVREVAPDCNEEIKYGGIVFNRDTTLITGIFIRKAHISLEFSFGSTFEDPEKILEGDGKYRRHLKLKNFDDIKTKKAREFITIAFK